MLLIRIFISFSALLACCVCDGTTPLISTRVNDQKIKNQSVQNQEVLTRPPEDFPDNDGIKYKVVQAQGILSTLKDATTQENFSNATSESSTENSSPPTTKPPLSKARASTIKSSSTSTSTSEVKSNTHQPQSPQDSAPVNFPKNSTDRFVIRQNETALAQLLNPARKVDNSGEIRKDEGDEEVEDLLEGGTFKTIHELPTGEEIKGALIEETKEAQFQKSEEDDQLDQSEWIESEGDEKDKYVVTTVLIEPKGAIQGQTAIVLICIFLVFGGGAYFALMSWRKYLEKRYGNRQMLVEDDDDDIKHFSI